MTMIMIILIIVIVIVVIIMVTLILMMITGARLVIARHPDQMLSLGAEEVGRHVYTYIH